MPAYKIPKDKRALNTHIAKEEMEFLRCKAEAESTTLTMAVRRLIWEAMQRSSPSKCACDGAVVCGYHAIFMRRS